MGHVGSRQVPFLSFWVTGNLLDIVSYITTSLSTVYNSMSFSAEFRAKLPNTDTSAHRNAYTLTHTHIIHKESSDSFGLEPTPLLSRKLGFSGAFRTSDPQRPSRLALGRPRVPLRSHAAVWNSTFRRHGFARELDVHLGDTQRLQYMIASRNY